MCKSLRQYGVVFTRTQFCTWHYLPRKENKSALDKRDAFYQWNNFLPKTTSLNVVLAEGELCNLGSGCAQVPSAALCRTRVRNLRVMIWLFFAWPSRPFPFTDCCLAKSSAGSFAPAVFVSIHRKLVSFSFSPHTRSLHDLRIASF